LLALVFANYQLKPSILHFFRQVLINLLQPLDLRRIAAFELEVCMFARQLGQALVDFRNLFFFEFEQFARLVLLSRSHLVGLSILIGKLFLNELAQLCSESQDFLAVFLALLFLKQLFLSQEAVLGLGGCEELAKGAGGQVLGWQRVLILLKCADVLVNQFDCFLGAQDLILLL
jgi:hypothetical protein